MDSDVLHKVERGALTMRRVRRKLASRRRNSQARSVARNMFALAIH